MKSSFKIKKPNSSEPTLIYFQSFFKDEGKSFIYSTGQRIHPQDWDLKYKRPIKNPSKIESGITLRNLKKTLEAHVNLLDRLSVQYEMIDEKLTIDIVRLAFDKEFKKSSTKTNGFFKVYDIFLDQKINDPTDKGNSPSTIKRYQYNKNLLLDFEKFIGKPIRFSAFNQTVYQSFLRFSIEQKKHSANTLSRNVGLLKTFLFWAEKNKYTYNDEFKNFENVKRFPTEEIAFNINQIKEIKSFDLSNNIRLEKVRDLFLLGCATGFRYGNYSKLKKTDIINDFICVTDVKDSSKSLKVPMNEISRSILEKYDYSLPSISNQKFNKYVKELFQILGFNENAKKSMRYGKHVHTSIVPLYMRVNSHTARRSFITIMKNKGVPDKVIMGYTGHKSIQNFNLYYKPSENDSVKYMNDVFG
ncbi:tyrosine-type recombinase/integrase [uncultured Dokdonia sp.]|uniref:tyrosine-type recombinase/integrase n=1 Tax=uncultured Dokdonia sp. TaxID=575653 RepID=UPI0030EF9514|tara:strand:+ start:291 stop:1535 length:1245 start_codon:yes stop_codon:yes gene_type:complete